MLSIFSLTFLAPYFENKTVCRGEDKTQFRLLLICQNFSHFIHFISFVFIGAGKEGIVFSVIISFYLFLLPKLPSLLCLPALYSFISQARHQVIGYQELQDFNLMTHFHKAPKGFLRECSSVTQNLLIISHLNYDLWLNFNSPLFIYFWTITKYNIV